MSNIAVDAVPDESVVFPNEKHRSVVATKRNVGDKLDRESNQEQDYSSKVRCGKRGNAPWVEDQVPKGGWQFDPSVLRADPKPRQEDQDKRHDKIEKIIFDGITDYSIL